MFKDSKQSSCVYINTQASKIYSSPFFCSRKCNIKKSQRLHYCSYDNSSYSKLNFGRFKIRSNLTNLSRVLQRADGSKTTEVQPKSMDAVV